MIEPTLPSTPASKPRSNLRSWLYDILLVLILLAGLLLRLAGTNWGEYQYLHPDERFLVWVGSDIAPVENLSDYFDTANSSLNPHNRGHGFYVYGTLPMFLTRYVVEWVYGHSGFQEMTDVGRPLSAVADLLTVYLVYLVAARVYNKRAALLAAAFSAFAVLQIQQAHFFTMDTFINLFTLLAVYFAVRVAGEAWGGGITARTSEAGESAPRPRSFLQRSFFWLSIGFGFALGCAVASKLNAAPVAVLLPLAFGLVMWKTPATERPRRILDAFGYLVLAAVVSLLVFRLFQPYAFSGPGFFGLKPNPAWVQNIIDQRDQAAGDIDFPPALQWARRPVWFSFQNLTLWGLGLPLGILAWAGFLWAGWRMLKGEWQRHILLWGWTALYFTWQSLQFNPTMRYQLPVYPMLAIFAGWVVVALYEHQAAGGSKWWLPSRWARLAALVIGISALVATGMYALAFSSIYTRPITRVAASHWIYQNVPGPINLRIQTEDDLYNQPLPITYGSVISPGKPLVTAFVPKQGGLLSEVYLHHVSEQEIDAEIPITVEFASMSDGSGAPVQWDASVNRVSSENLAMKEHVLYLDPPLTLEKENVYFLTFSTSGPQPVIDLCGAVVLVIDAQTGPVLQTLPGQSDCVVQAQVPYDLLFVAQESGTVSFIYFDQAKDVTPSVEPMTLSLHISPTGDERLAAEASLTANFSPAEDGLGAGYHLTIEPPITLDPGVTYQLELAIEAGQGALAVQGAGLANEGDWDDGLPLRVDGYDGFGGIYPSGLDFQAYWDDNPEKLERFLRIYDQAEYIVITSNRQWGTLPRLPERFPLMADHYRYLLGCPEQYTIEWCYRVAQPGMFQGQLGFELVAVFQSDPTLGPIQINDQFAEEAFTVYDHPKVFIFQKTEAYDSYQARALLEVIDFNQVIHVTPKKAPDYPATMILPTDRLDEQRAGGTWSDLFNVAALQNRFQVLGIILWYLSVAFLGLIAYPLLRLALPGLPDRGFPLSRIAGMLIFSYLVWLGGSLRIPVTRLMIGLVLLALALFGAYLAYRNRDSLRQEWRERRTYFLLVEGLTLALFVLMLLIRLGNPDLWHPYHGGEKPMDFAYFNAVLKSTTFPPYDPWYAGGYLNYYYYGFIFVGMLVKLLGIVPAFAYNLILPTLFSMVGLGAFSLAFNLRSASQRRAASSDDALAEMGDADRDSPPFLFNRKVVLSGLTGTIAMLLLGNLGTLRMILRGYMVLGIPEGLTESTPLLSRVVGVFSGLARVVLQGESLRYYIGDWYWIPSRAIAALGDTEVITEFPLFTFLYGDMHAHMIALVMALLVLAWAVSVVLGKARWPGLLAGALGFFMGGLAIGALYPTNLSDMYTYLPIGLAALAYGVWRYATEQRTPWLSHLSPGSKRIVFIGIAVILMGLLVLLSFGLFQPYRAWYGQPYSDLGIWKGSRTPLGDYLIHWGAFLFVIVTWMLWETREWMAHTPLSALRKVNWSAVLGLLVILIMVILLLALRQPDIDQNPTLANLPVGRGIQVAWLALPLAAWAGVLLLRPQMPDVRRLVLFWIGTALLITLVVEVVVVQGDIGRMNTVFKFYLQAWTLLAISAAAAFGWLLMDLRRWRMGWRISWQVILTALVVSAALVGFLGGAAKIKNRVNAAYADLPAAPHTLDGMAYMPFAKYYESRADGEQGQWMDLAQDYQAICWLQENVQGSPVIAEAPNNGRQYRWFSRYSIYTGLPGVVGWEWHQQQQRALNPSDWVTQRARELDQFYLTMDTAYVTAFLREYDVSYIVVGQLERISYPELSLQKFADFNGVLWREVYRDRDTVIYEVIK